MSTKTSKLVRIALAAAIAASGAIATTAVTVTAAQATTASSTNGPISRSEILARAQYWYNQKANIPYNQDGYYPDQQGAYYRTDCSGYVSMAWHLGAPGTNTQGLPDVSYEISRSDLRPGDILNSFYNHVILFEKWDDAAHTIFSYYSFGSTPVKHRTGISINADFDSHLNSEYKALRYKNVTEDAAPGNVQLDIVGGDGAMYSQFGNYDAGRFNGSWANVGGASLTKVTSVTVGGDLVHFYAVAGGRVYGRDHIPSTNTWTGWGEIPGGAVGVKDLAASVNGNNVILSIVGADGVLYTQYGNYDQGHFDQGWTKRNGAGLTNITTVTGDSNTIRIYAIGSGGRVYGEDFTLSTNSTGAWGEIPGGAVGVKDLAGSMNGNDVVLSIVGADGVLYTQYGNYDQGHFDQAWTKRNGAGLTNVATVTGGSNTIRIYAIGSGGRVYGEDFTLSTNSTGAWGEIPGGATSAMDITAATSN